jgi:hypothetical protein
MVDLLQADRDLIKIPAVIGWKKSGRMARREMNEIRNGSSCNERCISSSHPTGFKGRIDKLEAELVAERRRRGRAPRSDFARPPASCAIPCISAFGQHRLRPL